MYAEGGEDLDIRLNIIDERLGRQRDTLRESISEACRESTVEDIYSLFIKIRLNLLIDIEFSFIDIEDGGSDSIRRELDAMLDIRQ